MILQTVSIDSVRPDPANARRHNRRNLDAIRASLSRFGQQKPIVVDSANVVRAGNGTLAAAKELGWKQIQIVRSDLSEQDLRAFAVADNRTAELAQWDPDVLAGMADELAELGFEPDELDRLLSRPMPALDESAKLKTNFEIVVQCKDESEQQHWFEKLCAEGLQCRLFTL